MTFSLVIMLFSLCLSFCAVLAVLHYHFYCGCTIAAGMLYTLSCLLAIVSCPYPLVCYWVKHYKLLINTIIVCVYTACLLVVASYSNPLFLSPWRLPSPSCRIQVKAGTTLLPVWYSMQHTHIMLLEYIHQLKSSCCVCVPLPFPLMCVPPTVCLLPYL